MKILHSSKWSEQLTGLIHEETQLQDQRIDLTVSEIHRLTESGSLDFGGSEFTPVGSEIIDPKNKNPADDYGWWELKIDTYKAVLNESIEIPDSHLALIQPHTHAEQSGLGFNTRILLPGDASEPLELCFHVPVAGCRIKQNARIASALLINI